jgi:hypothetical protein
VPVEESLEELSSPVVEAEPPVAPDPSVTFEESILRYEGLDGTRTLM